MNVFPSKDHYEGFSVSLTTRNTSEKTVIFFRIQHHRILFFNNGIVDVYKKKEFQLNVCRFGVQIKSVLLSCL